jgi:hypothetical protein
MRSRGGFSRGGPGGWNPLPAPKKKTNQKPKKNKKQKKKPKQKTNKHTNKLTNISCMLRIINSGTSFEYQI